MKMERRRERHERELARYREESAYAELDGRDHRHLRRHYHRDYYPEHRYFDEPSHAVYAHETAARIEYPATSAEAYERGYSYGYGHRPAYHRHRHYHSVRPWSASEQSYSDAESTGRYSSASSEGQIRHTVYTAPHAATYESHYREASPAETTRYSAPPQEYYRAEGRYYSGPSVTYHAKGGSAYADAPVETLIRHAIGEYDYKTPESEFQHRAG